MSIIILYMHLFDELHPLLQRAELQTLLRNVLLNAFIITSSLDLQYYKGKCILGIDITLFHHDSI